MLFGLLEMLSGVKQTVKNRQLFLMRPNFQQISGIEPEGVDLASVVLVLFVAGLRWLVLLSEGELLVGVQLEKFGRGSP